MKNEVFDIASKEEVKEAIDYLFVLSKDKTGFLPELILAVQSLKKQIPIEPIGRYTDFKCAVCGRRVRSGKGSSSRVRDNYCQRCGQRIDWSENDG